MSYEIIRGIKIKKDGSITITGASNNVRPLYYSTWNFNGIPEKNRLFVLFKAIIAGDYHLQTSCPARIRWAMMQVRKYAKEHNIDTSEIYCNQSKKMYDDFAKLIDFDFVYDGNYYNKENFDKDTYQKKFKKLAELIAEKYTEEEIDEMYMESSKFIYKDLYDVFLKEYDNCPSSKDTYVISREYCGREVYVGKLTPARLIYAGSLETAKKFDYVTALEKLEDVRLCYSGWENAVLRKVA